MGTQPLDGSGPRLRTPVDSMVSLVGVNHPDVGRNFGPYKVLSLLGAGGMGLVYLAEHVHLGRKVAIKRLKDSYAVNPQAVERFFEEARTANRIKHPNIVEITDFVEENGLAYCVMELLEGQTVAKALRIEGVLSPRRVYHVCYQVAEALAAAHKAGVVHRDIKPSNIFLTEREGQPDFVKLLDFGIAQLREALPREASSSFVGNSSLGTPAYMSPEQAAGGTVDARADIYSLGAVMYQMLAGQPPFQADSTPEYVYKHLNVQPITLVRLKGVPQRITPAASKLVMRCLQKSPDDRPESAEVLMAQITRVARSTGVIIRPGSSPTLKVPRIQRRWAVFAALGVVVAITALLCMLIMGNRKTRREAAPHTPGDPGPASTAPSKITLNVKSNPSGAQVVRTTKVSQQILGLTPLTLSVPGSNEKWTLVIQRDGFEPKRQEILLDTDQTLNLDLRPVRDFTRIGPLPRDGKEKDQKARKGRRKKRRRTGSLIDPF